MPRLFVTEPDDSSQEALFQLRSRFTVELGPVSRKG